MLAIHPSFSLLQTALAPLVRPSFSSLKEIASNPKVQDIALRCIQGGSIVYLSSCGAFEFTKSVTNQETTTQKTEEIGIKTFPSSSSYLRTHGGWMLGSGVSYLLDFLNRLGIIYPNDPSTIFSTCGNVAFLCANICALDENIRLYQAIVDAKQEADPKLLHSACWGIASNTGYILAMGAVLFGYANALTLVIALLSCLAGGVKILYDVMILLGKNNQN